MKKILSRPTALLTAFAGKFLAAFAEFGEQWLLPAVASATDLSSYQYRVMRLSAARTCNVASHALGASGVGAAAGILQNNPTSGRAASIAYLGLSKAVAGAAVTVNAYISTDGSGYVIDAVSGTLAIGRALEASTTAGDVISVALFPPTRIGSVA